MGALENFLNKYLSPIAEWMDKNRYLSAIKKAMVAMTPLLIIGSFCLIPDAIPNYIGTENPISQWIMANSSLITIPNTVGMGLMGLYVTVIIAYHLSQHYKLDVPGATSMALIAFLLLAVAFDEEGGWDVTYLGTKGLFVSMVAAILAVEIYRWFKNKNITIKLPESVPDFVSNSFAMIPLAVGTVLVFLIIRIVCVNVFGIMPPLIFTNLLAPLVGSMDNPLAVTFLQILRCLLFFFGIHPSVLSPITSPISTQFLAENIAAVQAGGVATHFFTPGPESAFGNFTGTGVTFGLVFWSMLSKSDAQKKIGRLALIPALFGINEPILFGAPIVLNPIYFIPYVIFGGLMGVIPYWMMYFGILDCSTFTPPYVGVFLEGFLTNFDYMSIVANAIQMICSIVVWFPFFKIYEKRELEKEAAAAAEKAAGVAVQGEGGSVTISDEDMKLLDDMDLDF